MCESAGLESSQVSDGDHNLQSGFREEQLQYRSPITARSEYESGEWDQVINSHNNANIWGSLVEGVQVNHLWLLVV